MLQPCRFWLGRWSPRDFLRGRTKRGGAIHTRHTHGSRGRYKRLSSIFGLRDGRRHAWNHLNGGLGVKLGGGLFGLRIPRQHALSTMSKEEYEIELYGHPNITNPYRQRMDEHPDLKSVMCNAFLDVHVVILMPRVSRAGGWTEVLPRPWEELLHHLAEAMRVEDYALGNGGSFTAHLATISASVTCHDIEANALRVAAGSLLEDHVRGEKVGPLLKESIGQKPRIKRIPFFGPALSISSLPHSRSPVSLLSSTLNLIPDERVVGSDNRSPRLNTNLMDKECKQSCQAVTVSQRGVQQLLYDLKESNPHALSLCLRLGETLFDTNVRVQEKSSEEKTRESSRRKLLQKEIDQDEVGVWKQPAATVDALMRWQYFNWDPRAHCADGLPHHRRCQPVHIFVDASRVRGKSESLRAENGNSKRHPIPRSLLSTKFSEKLQEMDFKRVNHEGLAEMLEVLCNWSAEYHWRALQKLNCAHTSSA